MPTVWTTRRSARCCRSAARSDLYEGWFAVGSTFAAAFARFFAGEGLTSTTSHVTAAASEITNAMKTTIPSRPRTVYTEVG